MGCGPTGQCRIIRSPGKSHPEAQSCKYEIINEGGATQWQVRMIDFIVLYLKILKT